MLLAGLAATQPGKPRAPPEVSWGRGGSPNEALDKALG